MEKPIPFKSFDDRGEVRIYHHGTLPHWRQQGCTYFVTFSLADSLPQSVLRDLKNKRNRWLEQHHIEPLDTNWRDEFAKIPEEQQRSFERQMATNLNRELDCGYGSCVLKDPNLSEIVAHALEFHHGTRVFVGDYVIMPNHVHVLMTPIEPNELEQILKSIKSFTAKGINKKLRKSGTLWQRDSYDHIVRDAKQLEAFKRYIADNPTKAQLGKDCYRLRVAEYCFV